MRKLWLLIFGLLLMTLPNIGFAQEQRTPYISGFNTNLDYVTPDEAESGEKMALLTWNISGVQADQEVMLQVWVQGQWYDALPADADLHARDIVSHAVPHSLTFAPPLFRLVVRSASGEILTSKELEIPYQNPDLDSNLPIIETFEPAIESISLQNAQDGSLQIPVMWAVENRPVGANLIFEQVLPDGTTISAELPRDEPWVRSNSQGVVSPRITGEDSITLRLSMVHFETGDVYATSTLELPLPAVVWESDNEPDNSQPAVTSFASSTETVRPGDSLTLNWQTEGASRVFIEYLTADQIRSSWTYVSPTWSSDELPATGSIVVTIPRDVTSGPLAFFLYTDTYDWHDRTLADSRLTVELQQTSQPSATPRTVNFSSDVFEVQPGGTFALSWATENTERVYIELLIPDPERPGYIKRHSVSDMLPPEGTYTVSVPSTLTEGPVFVNLYLNELSQVGLQLANRSLRIEVAGV